MADHLYVVVALGEPGASREELHEAAEAVQQVLAPFVTHVIEGDVMVYQLTRYLAERVGGSVPEQARAAGILYCRRCDLAFCERHLDEHDGDEHELTADPRASFCSVCTGVYAPRPSEHSGSRRLDVLERDAPHLIAPIEPTDV